MNNIDIKSALSGVQSSEKTIEVIMDMTNDKKKNVISFKKISSVVVALAILVGTGFGVNSITNSNNVQTPSNEGMSNNNPLKVMVAYAGENYCDVGSLNNQNVFYSIHFADINNQDELIETKALYDKDYNAVLEDSESLAEYGYGASGGGGASSCFSTDKNEDTAMLYTVRGGSFALDLDDYSNVKNFTVSHSNEYGELYLQCQRCYDDDEYIECKDGVLISDLIGDNITITGDELRYSQESEMYSLGSTNIVNKGYFLNWDASDALYLAVANDLNFDLSQIKDTITFTVEFNDGTTQSASINLYFDKDGYMHFG